MQTVQIIPTQPMQQRFYQKFQPQTLQKPITHTFSQHRQLQPTQGIEFDGKRLRKAVTRKTVDYNSSIIKYLEGRVWQRDYRDRRAVQPDSAYYTEITPPIHMLDNPINAVTTKFVRTSTNKMRCPIFCVAWTPEGRRLVTGASSGEFTLWNGLTFNFETILQAHDVPVRCMVWSHNDIWMVTGDHAGYVKYWQSNMNNVKMFQAHKEALRGISFCPMDSKFTTCSDDGTVRIWDFMKCTEERILRGHGADVKCVDWHPQKALIVSGSKDSQQPIKLWDPKSGQSLATIHSHKNTVMDTKWNKNGNWLLTASRDHMIKLFDIRNMKEEMQTFRGHKKEATTLSWHPVHEGLFASGGSDGSVMFWVVGADKEVGAMEQAHDSCVWSLAWHPLGHILCSGSNDHTSKFWTRNRPGDRMRDKYNLNTLPKGQEDGAEYDDSGTLSVIPGMGLEHGLSEQLKLNESFKEEVLVIPGLDLTTEEPTPEKSSIQKKIPYAKPIPKQFQQQWMDSKQPLLLTPPSDPMENSAEHHPHPVIKTEPMPHLPPPPLPMQFSQPPPQVPMPNAPPDQNQNFPPPPFPPNMVNTRLPPPPNFSFRPPNLQPSGPPPLPPPGVLLRPPLTLLGENRPPVSEMNQSLGPAPNQPNCNIGMMPPPDKFMDNQNMPPNPNMQNRNRDEHRMEWRKISDMSHGPVNNGFPPENPHDFFPPNRPFSENGLPPDQGNRPPPNMGMDDFGKGDIDLRQHPGNMREPHPEEMGYNPDDCPWRDDPDEDMDFPDHHHQRHPPEHLQQPHPDLHQQRRDFCVGPPPPQPDFIRPLLRPRGGERRGYFGGRGHRGNFRSNRSPYHVVHHRGRGGRGDYE